MKTDKHELINDLRQKYCRPCTTANSCSGCLVDVMEEVLRQPTQRALDKCPRCEGTGKYQRLGFAPTDCAVCNGTGICQ